VSTPVPTVTQPEAEDQPPPVPRVPTPVPTVTQPEPEEPPTPAHPPPLDDNAPPTVAYSERSGNAGQRRRRQAKAKTKAKQLNVSPTALAEHPSPHITRAVSRQQQSQPPRNTATRCHTTVPTQQANLISQVAPTVPTNLTAAERSQLPAHAFWTANTVVEPHTGAALEYRHLKLGPDGEKWIQGAANEIGRLAEGVQPHMPTGTETMHFIHHDKIPNGCRATYLKIVASYRPHKAEAERVRFTCGGDRIEYKGKVSTAAAELTTVKLLLNSTISTAEARWVTYDINDFYLDTPMNKFEYM
jgi:hypothetical protein